MGTPFLRLTSRYLFADSVKTDCQITVVNKIDDCHRRHQLRIRYGHVFGEEREPAIDFKYRCARDWLNDVISGNAEVYAPE